MLLYGVGQAQYDTHGRFSVIPDITGWGTEKPVRYVLDGSAATFAVVPTGADREGLALFRFNTLTGESDVSFGVGGGVFIPIPDSLINFQIVSIRSTERGYTVLGVAVTRVNPSPLRAIAFAITKTGELDENFGSLGVSASAFPEIDSVYPASEIIGDSDAFFAYGISRDPEVWTLSASGEWARRTELDLHASAISVLRDIRGRWVTVSVTSGDMFEVTVSRKHADGTVDDEFGTNGQVRWEGEYSGGIAGFAERPDGSYVVAARLAALADPNDGRIQLLAIPSDGSRIDTAVTTFNGLEEHIVPNSMSVDSENRILLAGIRFALGRALPFVARMLENLRPDPIYGSRGIWTPSMTNLPAGVGEDPRAGEGGSVYFLVNVGTGLGSRFVFLQEASEVRVGVNEIVERVSIRNVFSDGSIEHLERLGFTNDATFTDLTGQKQRPPLTTGCWFHGESRRIILVRQNR